MYFKALEIKGFKSFIDETRLEFSKGVTAVVGPNGCGKSNIYDAIRWVLGEQSSKALRGRRMEDLIFSGTQARKPHGMAEVSLIMSNINGELPSEWGNFDEIKVTRRLFRDGESEYYINKIPCRLKDIVDLFLDTGVSTQAFSIIEQGQIESVINSKPEDRRFLIEEAAGIIKYKHKKNIALRKLEHSNQNLLRLNDIISELKRQINSLRRQAKKAERYKKYQKRIQELEISLFSQRYSDLKEEFEIRDREFGEISSKETELSAKNSTLENRIEDLKLNIVGDERDLSSIRGEAFDLIGRTDKLENRIELLKSQIENIKEEKERAQKESALLKERIKEIDKEIIERGREEEKCSEELNLKQRLLSDKRGEVEALEERMREKEDLLNQKNALHIELMSQISQCKNEIDSLKNRLDNLEYKEERLEGESRADSERQKDFEERLERGRKESLLLEERLEKIKGEKKSAEEKLEEARLKERSSEDRIIELQNSIAIKSSRLKSLEELEINLEGYQQGIRYLLNQKNKSSRVQGIHGVVADLLEVDSEYEVALGAVLGERVQSLVVENHENIEKAIQCLKSHEGGRGTFIPKSPKRINNNGSISLNGERGIIGKALDLVKYKSEFKDVLEFLLGDVVVVEDFSIALGLWVEKKFNHTLVTLDGDILEPSGIAVGGNFKNNANLQLLKKRRLMRELKSEMRKLESELDKNKELRNEIAKDLERFQKELEGLNITRTDLEKESLELGKDLQHLEEEYLRIKERIDLFDFEKSQLKEEKEEISEKIEEAEKSMSSFVAKKEEHEEEIGEVQHTIVLLNEDRDKQKSELTEMAISLTSLKGKRENSQLKLQQTIEKKKETEDRIGDLEEVLVRGDERQKECIESIKEMEISLKDLFEKKKIIEGSVKEKEEILSEKKRDLEALEEETKGLRKNIDELKTKANEIDIKRTETGTKMKSIEERLSQDYGLSIEAIREGIEKDTLSENEEQELEDLRQRLSKMGDVNLTALEEYKNLETRYNFLNEQKEDLTQSIESLHSVIDRINRTTKSMFKNTFDKVNASFQDMFSRLFEGGKGELILTDESNLLETGLDIMVQPAGKRLQNISLLSAGEKALTVISLLFALFLVKTGPFCLLDEVDAPLDETNINRFANILTELSQKTQFILITHNKRTMSFADVLYGITMEEEGISKVVSLKLNNKEN